MAKSNSTPAQDAAEVKTYSIRAAARYLQDHGADIGEMRMRSLLRQNEIFTGDPDTRKGKTGDSEIETWAVSQAALDKFLQARENGTVRANTGAKAYKLLLTAEQFAKAREVLAAAGLPEPARLNKPSQGKKVNGTTSGSGAVGSDGQVAADDGEGEDTLEAMLAADESN